MSDLVPYEKLTEKKYPRQGRDMVHFTEDVIELCFEIWAFEASQSAVQTVKNLHHKLWSAGAGLVDYYNLNSFDEIQPDHIYRWAQSYRWKDLLEGKMLELMPQLKYNTLRDMGLALTDSVRISNEIMQGYFSDAKKAMVQLKAVHGLWDRVGFAPRTDVQTPQVKEVITVKELSQMSIDELLEKDDMIKEREAIGS